MTSHLSNPWNNTVSLLRMFYGEQLLSSGSCFFWGFDNRTYLVTNWHNLSGRNALTGEPLSSNGGLPNLVEFTVYERTSEPDVAGFVDLRWVTVQAPLYDNDFSGRRWSEHPKFGRQVDVAALDVTDVVARYDVRCANAVEDDAVLDSIASQDLFVIGFPFGLLSNAPAPIWKRASLAVDPSFDVDDLPKMLIDTATREGMSGSVVVARHMIVGKSHPRKDGSRSTLLLFAKRDVVIGIYSGRHYPDLERAQLGIAWKRTTIEDVVSAHAAGTFGDDPAV